MLSATRQVPAAAGKWLGTMTHAPIFARTQLHSWLCACSMLVGLAACDAEPLDDADTEFRAVRVELESLEPGHCLPLDDTLTSVTTGEWTLWPGLPKNIIIDDHLLLTSVFEDNVMLRISGPASTEGEVLTAASATALYDDPELENDCGSCDGVCVDGMCIMDLSPYAISSEGICNN